MVNPMVERATSSMLIGPDWAMNIEICDMLNREPGQAKDVVKGIKKRIGSKNSKVQLLALTLLETIVKNCGDIVHMHVAERDVLHDMVKIVKKKPDYQVKEKVLILIDTWQEAFGGARARYPQYYAAYQELLRAGAVFPQRSERSAPVLTPPQSHPLSSYPPNIGSSDPNLENARAETSDSEFPTLSLSEIQNAKGSMDVLTEMLSALDPGNKEGLRQEALVDLVEQCRTYKQRVVHLVNSTSDESLLCQGLALNDDLQRVLAKYESLVSGKAVPLEKPEAASAPRSLVDVDGPLVDAGESSKQADKSSAPGTSAPGPSSLAPPPSANGSASIPKTDPKMDLLSGDLLGGDDFGSPAQNSLALVPVAAAQPSSPVANDQNALALVDMFSSSPNATSSQPTPFSAGPGFQQLALQPQQPHFQAQQQFPPQQQFQPQQQQQYQPQQQQPYQPQQQQYPFYQQQGINPGMGMTYEQPGYPQQVSGPSWGTPTVQQPSSPAHGAQNGGALPPPPWEAQSDSQPGSPYSPTVMQGGQQPLGLPAPGNNQVVGMFVQPVTSSQLTAINQSFQMPHSGMYPQQQQHMQVGGGQNMMNVHPQAMQAGHQMAPMYPQNMYGNPMQMGAGGGYGGYESGYGVQQDVQYMDQRMYGLSMRDDTGARSSVSSQSSMASYLPPMRQQGKGDDKLFGDLVNMAKLKPTKSAPSSTAGST